MTEEEYYVMKIRQLKILRHQEARIRGEISEIQKELDKVSDKDFMRYKDIADGVKKNCGGLNNVRY